MYRVARSASIRTAAVLLAGAVIVPSAAGQCQYEVTVIQGPSCPIFGPRPTTGTGLNELGHVVGFVGQCDLSGDDAFLWTPEDGLEILPRPPGIYSAYGADINDAGAIVGEMSGNGDGAVGFLYEDGIWTLLPPVSGGWSHANAINEHGVVVGRRSIGKTLTPWNAFVWSARDGFTDLGLMGATGSTATEISGTGDVVGYVGGLSADEGFHWQNGRLTLLGPIPGGLTSGVGGITDSGIMVGGGRVQRDDDELTRGCIWDADSVTVIEPIDDGHITATAVNEVGQIVLQWSSRNPSGFYRAWLHQHGTLHDLNELVPDGTETIERPKKINNKGQIVADGGDGHTITFLLTPVGRPTGDVDIDCTVGPLDLLVILDEWANINSPADLDQNGYVGIGDLLIVLSSWAE
jgi:uncharacterized membrane protein